MEAKGKKQLETQEFYILPHQTESWAKKQKLLIQVKESKDISEACNAMNQIIQKGNWSSKCFNVYNDKQAKADEVHALLKFAAERALQVEKLFPSGIKISQVIEGQGKTYTALTKRQALCLSTNMFFCTVNKQPDFKNLPIYYNFYRLSRGQNEIVKTFLNYLRRCFNDMKLFDSEYIVYFRLALPTNFEEWMKCQEKLCKVDFKKYGLIEQAEDAIQIDFANKSIGGFFLSETFTQEDIIFINNPELMPALLFHKYMDSHECILMVGAERYSLYSGYLESYQFKEDFKDNRKGIKLEVEPGKFVLVKDSWISAIDAIPYFIDSEYNVKNLNRQLTKAYIGFHIMNLDGGQKQISTGNWGSGAFNGNLEYKFLIQWLAVSRSKRDMLYYSFSNEQASRIPEVVEKLKGLTVKQLSELMVELSNQFLTGRRVFDILLKHKI